MADKKAKAPAKKPRAKTPSSTAKVPRPAGKATAKGTKAPTGVLPKRDRRGTPKGKATGAGKGRGGGGKIGNPKFEPTDQMREQVLSHAAVGTPHPIIADQLGFSESTLTKYFQKELAQGLPTANATLGGVLYKGALAGDAKKLEMWFDRRGGPEWRKKSGVELSGPNGAPIRHEELSKPSDFAKLPIEKRRQLESLLREAEAVAGQADEPA